MRHKVLAVGLVAAICDTGVGHAADAMAGKQKAALCVACHGVAGNSTNGLWPKLAGQHQMYLVKTLRDFRSGVRKDASMNAMAKSLSDADIANLATYYASERQK